MKGFDMFKTAIAGVTALSLTLASATPAQAGGISQEDLGKLLFGLVAVATIGTAIKNNDRNRQVRNTPQSEQPPQRTRNQNRLPRRCVDSVDTWYGAQQIVDRDCLEQRYRHVAQLPRQCQVRVYTNRGPRNGFDPHCLRDEGYRLRRR